MYDQNVMPKLKLLIYIRTVAPRSAEKTFNNFFGFLLLAINVHVHTVLRYSILFKTSSFVASPGHDCSMNV